MICLYRSCQIRLHQESCYISRKLRKEDLLQHRLMRRHCSRGVPRWDLLLEHIEAPLPAMQVTARKVLERDVPNPSPALGRYLAPMGPEIYPVLGLGSAKAPGAFPDSSSVLDQLQFAICEHPILPDLPHMSHHTSGIFGKVAVNNKARKHNNQEKGSFADFPCSAESAGSNLTKSA